MLHRLEWTKLLLDDLQHDPRAKIADAWTTDPRELFPDALGQRLPQTPV